jgi:hypothetical protein
MGKKINIPLGVGFVVGRGIDRALGTSFLEGSKDGMDGHVSASSAGEIVQQQEGNGRKRMIGDDL